MMLRFLTVLALVTLLSGAAVATEPAGWVPGTEDVPLMPGLAPTDEAGLIFDKPQGRIVEASARGSVSRHAVLAFYQESLPQLGWRLAGERQFLRDGERLSLGFNGRDGNLLVDFTLVPH
jgi:hypothetical protein